MCTYVLSFVLWCPLRFPHKNDVRFQLFVGWFMSYLCYLCLIAYSGVQHILFTLYCQFIWIVHFWVPLWYYLTCIFVDLLALIQESIYCDWKLVPTSKITFIVIHFQTWRIWIKKKNNVEQNTPFHNFLYNIGQHRLNLHLIILNRILYVENNYCVS